jgi:hypothetical protein
MISNMYVLFFSLPNLVCFRTQVARFMFGVLDVFGVLYFCMVFDLFCSRIFLVFMFFGCLVCFFTLVLFLAYFRVKSRFLGRFMVESKISGQPNRINSVGSTRTKNIWGQRVLITCLVCHVFVKGSFS